IQELNIFWKKAIVFAIVISLGIPFCFLIGRNFQKRLKEFDKEKFLEGLKFPAVKEEMKSMPLDEVKERMGEINAMLEETEQMAPTTTSTNNQ
ncbi:unnamed protein product, partial [marine sediment metagenome]